ncbi:MAG: PAS domain-containing methyl-accepting chemotaxis protein [Comamonas sp.]
MQAIRSVLARLGLCSARRNAQMQALYRNQAVIEFDARGHVLYANAQFLELMGYRMEELQGQHHRIFVDQAEHDEQAYGRFWSRLGAGEAFVGRCKRLARDGRGVWLQANYSPVLDRNGRVLRVVKYATDISAEVRRDAEASSQLAAVGQAQAVIEFTLDGHILRCNRNFLDALGYSTEEELIGKHHSLFVDPQERHSAQYAAFWSQLAEGQHYRGQFRRIGRRGNDVWIEANYSPVLDQSGQPFKVVKYATDITARFEATQLVQAAFEQLQQLVRDSAAQARDAHAQTRDVASIAQRGDAALDQAVDAMSRIKADSKRIGEMVSLIDGIAFQTNLLALNAAVEAARAGEHGRGFAVVASEVRSLAQRSAEAAREVNSVIGHSTVSVQHGVVRVNESGDMMRQMRASAARASDIMDQIIQASNAQDERLGDTRAAVLQLQDAVIQR